MVDLLQEVTDVDTLADNEDGMNVLMDALVRMESNVAEQRHPNSYVGTEPCVCITMVFFIITDGISDHCSSDTEFGQTR